MAGNNVFLEHVVPVIGGFVAACLFLSSYPAVRAARNSGVLGELNVVPFIFIIANCISWSCYAFVTQDFYVFIPNTIGLMIGMYLFLVSYGLTREQTQRDKLISLLMPLVLLLLVVASIERMYLSNTPESDATKKLLWGYTANGILLCFYSSPLSTVANVIKTKDSSSLTLPLCVMNVINGTLWLMYGLAVGDYFIWVPNGIGAMLGAFQTALCLVFTKKAASLPLRSSASYLASNDHCSLDAA